MFKLASYRHLFAERKKNVKKQTPDLETQSFTALCLCWFGNERERGKNNLIQSQHPDQGDHLTCPL